MVILVLFLLLQLLPRLLLFDKNNDDGDAGGMGLFKVPSLVDFGGTGATGATTAVTAGIVVVIVLQDNLRNKIVNNKMIKCVFLLFLCSTKKTTVIGKSLLKLMNS